MELALGIRFLPLNKRMQKQLGEGAQSSRLQTGLPHPGTKLNSVLGTTET